MLIWLKEYNSSQIKNEFQIIYQPTFKKKFN